MKVGMIGWEFPPFKAGGLGAHCLELTKRLCKNGVYIDFYMPKSNDKVEAIDEKMRIIKTSITPTTKLDPYLQEGADFDEFFDAVDIYNLRAVDAFEREWDMGNRVDILHCHDWITVKAAVELKRRHNLPLIFTVHSTEYDRSAYFFPLQWIIEIEKLGMDIADSIIAVSGRTKNLIEREYGIDGDKIKVIYNGINFEKFWWHKKRDYDRVHNQVVYLGRVTRQKGPNFFIQVAKRVLEKVDCDFVLCGKGDKIPELTRQSAKYGISRNIKFTGYVPEEQLIDYYYHSDIYLLPAISEPFGITVLEAMASGLPTIISKNTGVGESLEHCLKVDFWNIDMMANMVIILLNSSALREELGRNGAEEVQQFTWENTADSTLKLYEELI